MAGGSFDPRKDDFRIIYDTYSTCSIFPKLTSKYATCHNVQMCLILTYIVSHIDLHCVIIL